LFWDSIHPTTAGHQLIGDLAFDALNSAQGHQLSRDLAFGALDSADQESVPEPTSVLAILVFGVSGAGLMLKRKQ
jgi:phospholipase/lecithinase/hemolysin